MSNELESASQVAIASNMPLSESIQQLFSRLRSSDVEQFINAYRFWTLHQEIDLLNLQIALTQQELLSNKEQLQLSQPTAIELAALAQLQSSGVSDIDLLDRMHARGELWLDNALQLLEHCERLDMIQGGYTQWCEHALEGAYDWLSSIDDDDLSEAQPANTQTTEPSTSIHNNEIAETTEEILLQKLFSENDEIATQTDLPEIQAELPETQSDTAITELNITASNEKTEAEELPTYSELNIPAPDEKTEIEELPEQSGHETILSNSLLEAETELPKEPSAAKTTQPLTTDFDSETAEDMPEQPEGTFPEEQTIPNVSEEEPVISNVSETEESEPETNREPAPEAEKESSEHVETHEISEHPETLEEPTEPVKPIETLDESSDLTEETEETPEQPPNPKRSSLVNRFVGRIFPKG